VPPSHPPPPPHFTKLYPNSSPQLPLLLVDVTKTPLIHSFSSASISFSARLMSFPLI
jgi:hypothetical protein